MTHFRITEIWTHEHESTQIDLHSHQELYLHISSEVFVVDPEFCLPNKGQ